MTGKERNVLDRIEEKVDRLMEFMATSTERAKGCERRFIDLETIARFNRKTLLMFMGGLTMLGFLLGLAVKVLR